MLIVELDPAVTEDGLNDTVTPPGWPAAESDTACAETELTAVLTVVVVDPPAVTEPELGETATEKSLLVEPDVPGKVQCCALVPLHDQICNCVPAVVLEPGSSRHNAETEFTNEPFAPGCHCCADEPLQPDHTIFVPDGVPPPETVMHPPKTRKLPSGSTVHCCAPVPLQLQIWIGFPFVVAALLSSTHKLDDTADTMGPVGGLANPTANTCNAP